MGQVREALDLLGRGQQWRLELEGYRTAGPVQVGRWRPGAGLCWLVATILRGVEGRSGRMGWGPLDCGP